MLLYLVRLICAVPSALPRRPALGDDPSALAHRLPDGVGTNGVFPEGPLRGKVMRPISLLTLWISEGLTQA